MELAITFFKLGFVKLGATRRKPLHPGMVGFVSQRNQQVGKSFQESGGHLFVEDTLPLPRLPGANMQFIADPARFPPENRITPECLAAVIQFIRRETEMDRDLR